MLAMSHQAVSAGSIENSAVNNLYKWENVLQTGLPRKWKLYYVESFFIYETNGVEFYRNYQKMLANIRISTG